MGMISKAPSSDGFALFLTHKGTYVNASDGNFGVKFRQTCCFMKHS